MYRGLLTLIIISFFIFGSGCNALNAETGAVDDEWSPSPTGAALRSLLFPGWGQVYNRKPLKAVIYSGIEQAFIFGIHRQHELYRHYDAIDDDNSAEFYRNNRNRQAWYLAAAMIVSVMDAYVDAHMYRFDVSKKLTAARCRNGFLGTGIVLNISWRMP